MLQKMDYQKVLEGKFDAFCELIHELRGENGCPWDRSQTFVSLKDCMLDEQIETLAAIDLYEDTKDASNLCEELGDVLLHIALLADMAKEQGMFSMEDVIRGIGMKMLRRHPHVFGENARLGWSPELLRQQSQLPETWKEIKQIEKAGYTQEQKKKQAQTIKNTAEWGILKMQEILDKP